MTLDAQPPVSVVDPTVGRRVYSEDMVHDAYASCDPQFAQDWLGRANLDVPEVARRACLSVCQVRQLLQGHDSAFYSLSIKRLAYRRALALLGAPQPVLPLDSPSSAVHRPIAAEPRRCKPVDIRTRSLNPHVAWAWLGLALLVVAASIDLSLDWLRTPTHFLHLAIQSGASPVAVPVVSSLPPQSP